MTRLRVVAGWLVLTILVVLAAWRVSWQHTVDIAANARGDWLALSVAVNAAILLLVALQWRLFLPREAKPSVAYLATVVGVVASVSNTGPMLLGYVAGVRYLTERIGVSAAAATAVLALEQLADAMAKLVLVGLLVALMPSLHAKGAGVMLLLLVAGLAVALLLLAHRPDLLRTVMRRAPRLLKAPMASMGTAMAQIETLRRPTDIGTAVLLGLAKKLAEGVGVYAAAKALGVQLPLWALVAVPIATNLVLSLSITPAGLGVYEGAAFLVLRAAGVEADSSTALAVLAHLSYLVPMVGIGWFVESARVIRTMRARSLIMPCIAGLGVVVHGWFALGGAALDSDAALVILMARHFAQGDWAVYFWQQSWMANLEPLLLTPLALVGLATPLAAGAVAMVLTAILATLSVRLAARMRGTTWVTLLCWAVPPALVVHHHVTLYGARLAATLLAMAAFACSLRATSRRMWTGVGVLLGVAFFGDHLMIAWAAAVIFVAARRGGLAFLAAGALPVVALDTAAAVMTPAFHLIGPNYPFDWVLNVPLLFGTALPQLFGLLQGRGPAPDWMPLPDIMPHDRVWLVFAVPGAVAIAVVIATLVRRRSSCFGDAASDEGVPAQALLVLTVVQLGLFVLVGGRGERWSVRYLVPLWPAISVFAAMAAAQWTPRRRLLASAMVLPAMYTLSTERTWPRAPDAAPAAAEAAAVARVVASTGVTAVWAEYWDAYRFALLIGERPRWVTYRVIERRPDWTREAREARPVAYLVRRGDAQLLAAMDSANRSGIRRLGEQPVGSFRLFVLERAVPGLEFRNPAPSRLKQVTAALSADLLFVGALLVIGVGVRRWRRTGTASEPPISSMT